MNPLLAQIQNKAPSQSLKKTSSGTIFKLFETIINDQPDNNSRDSQYCCAEIVIKSFIKDNGEAVSDKVFSLLNAL